MQGKRRQSCRQCRCLVSIKYCNCRVDAPDSLSEVEQGMHERTGEGDGVTREKRGGISSWNLQMTRRRLSGNSM